MTEKGGEGVPAACTEPQSRWWGSVCASGGGRVSCVGQTERRERGGGNMWGGFNGKWLRRGPRSPCPPLLLRNYDNHPRTRLFLLPGRLYLSATIGCWEVSMARGWGRGVRDGQEPRGLWVSFSRGKTKTPTSTLPNGRPGPRNPQPLSTTSYFSHYSTSKHAPSCQRGPVTYLNNAVTSLSKTGANQGQFCSF